MLYLVDCFKIRGCFVNMLLWWSRCWIIFLDVLLYFLGVFLLIFLVKLLYCNLIILVDFWSDDGIGISFGGTYLIISIDMVIIVNVKRVFILICSKVIIFRYFILRNKEEEIWYFRKEKKKMDIWGLFFI